MYRIVCMFYKAGLRDILLAAVDDPDKEWDELTMKIADTLMGYEDEDEDNK